MVEPVYGRWGPTEVMERVLDGTWAEVVDGMALIQPESISYTGTSAAITGLGSVEVQSVSSVYLNEIFSSQYDNYVVVPNLRLDAGQTVPSFFGARLSSNGVQENGSNYAYQWLYHNFGTRAGLRSVTSYVPTYSDLNCFFYLSVYGPALSQPTAFRLLGGSTFGTLLAMDTAATHGLSTSYDGLRIFDNNARLLSGRIAVYGLVN